MSFSAKGFLAFFILSFSKEIIGRVIKYEYETDYTITAIGFLVSIPYAIGSAALFLMLANIYAFPFMLFRSIPRTNNKHKDEYQRFQALFIMISLSIPTIIFCLKYKKEITDRELNSVAATLLYNYSATENQRCMLGPSKDVDNPVKAIKSSNEEYIEVKMENAKISFSPRKCISKISSITQQSVSAP